MDQRQLEVLIEEDIKKKEEYKQYKYPQIENTNILFDDLRKQVQKQQISFRKWLTIGLYSLHLDVLLSERQQDKNQPCILINSSNQICQLNNQAFQLGIRVGMNTSEIENIIQNILILKMQNQQSSQEVFNSILRYLQQIDKDVEVDFNNKNIYYFLIDVTNYMTEKGFENPADIASSIANYIHNEFKVESFCGIGANTLLSFLAAQMSFHSILQNSCISRIQEIKDFVSHLHLDIKMMTNLSESLLASLEKMRIMSINDINNNLIQIYQTFPQNVTNSLLQIYYGVSRNYHNVQVEIDQLKVSRMLKLGEYSIQQLQYLVDQIVEQITLDMKHYKRIAKIAKLQLTKIDHTNIVVKREILRIDSDYFDLLKSECFQMLKSLQIQNLLLQKITIQVFEMIPIDSIINSNITFAQRFYKCVQQQQQSKKSSLQPAQIKEQSSTNYGMSNTNYIQNQDQNRFSFNQNNLFQQREENENKSLIKEQKIDLQQNKTFFQQNQQKQFLQQKTNNNQNNQQQKSKQLQQTQLFKQSNQSQISHFLKNQKN
ncbi:ImpB/MucB/SamB family protein (macronuclear) [Tetrahymena thermophila SB210]|uniref:ImpB/MucB/SamB family protein n=1 Tax=Tetrahymena thermophila (strain SB210) TaxID=312017 RepID=I7LX68_TETTS|nr:ImpB/MucB/SamB family protein [Tetrahymena thermophila SB210]EAS03861.2 ImpB/MucB/SamB family protein [Tetrahymena thermophila SB210]|eukprot:XP_001024106.2 ImpB/MucB/SamB family protein [Tetrahymena thermophila SB210]